MSDHSELTARIRRESRNAFLWFVIASALSSVCYFILWRSHFLFGAYFFAGLAIVAWPLNENEWTDEEQQDRIGTLVVWTGALLMAWWRLPSAAEWLGIPMWASAIIVLLIIQIAVLILK